ncbi:hypothetical protein ACRXCV_04220 [Halobacteriovorax sp. GFR7]|uniref:hypothetical protein n=1 Tax=unclassified Halobacteriovorax TaxID=2639665 RepID=UPI003D99FD62
MKKLLLSFLMILTTYASGIAPSATDMKFVTDFTTFACKSFRDKVAAPNEIAALNVSFTKLGISDSTRRIILDVESNDGQCFYSADFSRQKGFKRLDFETSYMTDSPNCLELKEELDRYISPGFKYIIKYNAYISMLFLTKELTSVCDEVSGNKLIEFQWKI